MQFFKSYSAKIARIFFWIAGAASAVFLVFAIGVYLFWIFYKPPPVTYGIALGDLDQDGDLDAFYANGQSEGPQPNTVLFNDGSGKFSDSGQRLGKEESQSVSLGDLDGDRSLDAWVANVGYNTLFFNDGHGQFGTGKLVFDHGRIGTSNWSIALGDLDGDGSLDAVGGGCCGAVSTFSSNERQVHLPYSRVWLNPVNKHGAFLPGDSQFMESLDAMGTALGDLDGDGDLDIYFANNAAMQLDADQGAPQPDTIWWNDDHGRFTDSGQRLGQYRSTAVVLGDLDSDGDPDAFVGTDEFSLIWLNAGGKQGGVQGAFIDSGQRLGAGRSRQVFLARLDGNSSLDAAVLLTEPRTRRLSLEFWLNDGSGHFSAAPGKVSHPNVQAYALGDLNNDGLADIFGGWFPSGYAVWWNRGSGFFSPSP